MRMVPFVLRHCALLLILLSSVSFAQSTDEIREQAVRAWKAGNIHVAIERFETASRLGDTKAMHSLASIYEKGMGVPADVIRAKSLLRDAATRGDAEAQFYLYRILSRDAESKDSQQAAMKWLEESAKRGSLLAQTTIGAAYRSGTLFPKNSLEAKKWLQAAAVQGSASAHFNLGLMYAWGELGPRNLDEAYRYYRGAAMLGDAAGFAVITDLERGKRYAISGRCLFLVIPADTLECFAASVEFLQQRIALLESAILNSVSTAAAAKFRQDREAWYRRASYKCSAKPQEDFEASTWTKEDRQCMGAELASRVAAYLDMADYGVQKGAVDDVAFKKMEPAKQIAIAASERMYRDSWNAVQAISSITPRSSGKYYFEVLITPENFAKSKTKDLDLFVGITNGKVSFGKIMPITQIIQRNRQTVIGFLADLDAKKHYRHVDGDWIERSPKQGDGYEFAEASGPFRARMSRTTSLADLVNDGAIQINFGNRPFLFPSPPGYVGFERRGSFLPELMLP